MRIQGRCIIGLEIHLLVGVVRAKFMRVMGSQPLTTAGDVEAAYPRQPIRLNRFPPPNAESVNDGRFVSLSARNPFKCLSLWKRFWVLAERER